MPSSKPEIDAKDETGFLTLQQLRLEREKRTPEERAELERQWLIENAEAIRLENEYIEKHGPPFARFRQF